MMKTAAPEIALSLLLLFSSASSGAEIFQWTDSRGVIHFTDSLDSVPESLRNSPSLIIRQDFDTGRSVAEASNQDESIAPEPTVPPKAPEAVTPPNIIYYTPRHTEIVVINTTVVQSRKHSCLPPANCQGLFRPNFEDRRFIHPSVFDGGSRQFIRPQLFPPDRK